jgi:hypothetical protein
MAPASPVVPDLSGVNGTTASTNALIENFFKQQAETAAANKAAAEAKQKDRPKDWKSWLTGTGQQTPQDFATQQYANLGFDPKEYFNALKVDTAEIDALNKDLTATIAQRDQQIADVYGRAGQSLDFQNNSIAQINRNANVVINQKTGNINSKAALMQAKQGNFELAQGFVNKAVDAYTAQLKTDLQMTMDFYDNNQDLIDSLGKDYSTAITNLITTKQDELTEKRRQYEWEENMKLQRAQEARLGAGSGVTNGINTKIESSFREDGASLKQQVRDGALTNEKAYAQLRDLYSPNEVSDDYIKQYLGMATTETPATPSTAGTTTTSPIDKRIAEKQAQNIKMGFNKNLGIRAELAKEFPNQVQEVVQKTAGLGEKISNAIYNFLGFKK